MKSTVLPSILVSLGVTGLVLHKGMDYNPMINAYAKTPFVMGVLTLLLTRTSLLTEPPSRLKSFMQSTFMRFVLLLLVSYISTGDIENAIFLAMLFLGLIQLIRTKDERERHPYVL